jgi:hypothetical protein
VSVSRENEATKARDHMRGRLDKGRGVGQLGQVNERRNEVGVDLTAIVVRQRHMRIHPNIWMNPNPLLRMAETFQTSRQ